MTDQRVGERFFFAVVADDDECMSTHPAHAPRAALVGLANAEGDERDSTDFPRAMRVERWHYTGFFSGSKVWRKEPVETAALDDERRGGLASDPEIAGGFYGRVASDEERARG